MARPQAFEASGRPRVRAANWTAVVAALFISPQPLPLLRWLVAVPVQFQVGVDSIDPLLADVVALDDRGRVVTGDRTRPAPAVRIVGVAPRQQVILMACQRSRYAWLRDNLANDERLVPLGNHASHRSEG